MQRRHSQLHPKRVVQSRHVARPHQRLGPGGPHGVPVEQVEDPGGAVPSSGAEHRGDGRIAPGGLQVGGARGVRAGQVRQALPRHRVRAHHDPHAEPFQQRHPAREPDGVGRS
ncbi:hypothetical protein HNR40_009860 [Nonomuraea endophytica]|uniref:Uncharacterized protein n=1 Tax=Nonomuraea endophytica TaxID=714136 RepID=A0A7W8AFX8_9ACTN|nr:hypothetical protein [Nonomuraea endophytica]